VRCAWRLRVRVGDDWTETSEAIRLLRTYLDPLVPDFSDGICNDCEERVLAS
jgi:hypothetical protein